MPYVVRRLQRMDLTFFAEHSRTIPGRQRGINIDSWLLPFLALDLPATVQMRYRDLDSNRVVAVNRPIGRLQKNTRLHGQMIKGSGYLDYQVGDLMLLRFESGSVTWGLFRNQGSERALFGFLSSARNVEYRRNMGIVVEPAAIQLLEQMLSKYDPALFFADEVEALESEPTSTAVRQYIRRRVSPQAFANLRRACERNGRLGEAFVVENERRRLSSRGFLQLASRVQHIAAEDVTSPFDVLSFDGFGANPEREKYIEVKSTSGRGDEFEMSSAEWRFAESIRDQHVICRVTEVTSLLPVAVEIRDIVGAVSSGAAERKASAYKIRLARLE